MGGGGDEFRKVVVRVGGLPSPEPAVRSAALGAVLAPGRALEELPDLCGEFKASFKLPRLH